MKEEEHIIIIDDREPEEQTTEQKPVRVEEQRGKLVFIRNDKVEISHETRPFSDKKYHEGQIPRISQLPIHGTGVLDNAVVVSDSRNYSLIVEVDESNIVDDTFQNLERRAEDLGNISAYEDTSRGDFVVVVEDYDFKDRFDMKIIPERGEIQIDDYRIEIMVDEFK